MLNKKSGGVGGGMASSVFSLNFSSAGNWSFLTGKAKNMHQRCTVLLEGAGGGGGGGGGRGGGGGGGG